MYSQLTDFSTLPIKKLNDPPEKVSHEEFKRRLKEIVKCKSDIVYFAEHYFHVVTSMVDESGAEKGTRTELIKLYAKQKDLLRAMVDNKRLITLAARQSGKCVVGDTKITIRFNPLKLTFSIPIKWFFHIQKLLSRLSGN